MDLSRKIGLKVLKKILIKFLASLEDFNLKIV